MGVVVHPRSSLSDQGLAAGTTPPYTIRAVDRLGNNSALSAEVPVTTPPLNRAPELALIGPLRMVEGATLTVPL